MTERDELIVKVSEILCRATRRFVEASGDYPFPRTKALLGGPFGYGGYHLVTRGTVYLGLDAVMFYVIHGPSKCVLAAAMERASVMEMARMILSAFDVDERTKLYEAAAAAYEDQRVICAEAKLKRIQELGAAAKANGVVPIKSVPKRRRAIFDKSEGKCHYCATPLTLDGRWHIEHKMPRALLGGSETHNLVASCVACNMAKKDKTDLEFQAARGTAA